MGCVKALLGAELCELLCDLVDTRPPAADTAFTGIKPLFALLLLPQELPLMCWPHEKHQGLAGAKVLWTESC